MPHSYAFDLALLRPLDAKSLEDAHILIVNANVANSALLRGFLSRDGFKSISQAANGAEALQLLRILRPELVITDLVMPVMNGFDLISAIRADPLLGSLPVIVQTGFDSADDRARVFTTGASDLIIKPIHAIELTRRVRLHLARQRLLDRFAAARRKIEEDLEEARKMQEALLPTDDELAAFAQWHTIDVAADYRASAGLGGDIWGFNHRLDGRLEIFMCDFAGHGVRAALNTFRLHAYMKSVSAKSETPAQSLTLLNELLCEVLPRGQYATMFMGFLDQSRGMLEFSCAANPPIPYRRSGKARYDLLDGSGFPLGVTTSAQYETTIVPFDEGASLVLYSDALIETPPPPDSVFTPESFCEFLNRQSPTISARECCDAVLSALFSDGTQHLDDDLTMVVMRNRKDASR